MIKISISGTHSTGKTTFLDRLRNEVSKTTQSFGSVNDLAIRAQEVGFPILRKHTYFSTLWIMAECMKCESEASLNCDVLLIDRPVFDAYCYLAAALKLDNRIIKPTQICELREIARLHLANDDLVVITSLDQDMPIGPGRDDDHEFRSAVAAEIGLFAEKFIPNALHLTSNNVDEVLAETLDVVHAALAHP